MPSDEEILCGFMEPRPEIGPWSHRPWRSLSAGGWWTANGDRNPQTAPDEWFPIPLTLDRLHEIEARLTEEQWSHYLRWLMYASDHPDWSRTVSYGSVKTAAHASAEQKIRALAAVLREGKDAE